MNEQLHELEEQLETMSKQKLYFIYVSILVLFVFLSWNLFGEELNSQVQTKQDSIASLENKLKKNSMKSLQAAISKTNKESLKLKEQIQELEFQDKFIFTKLESMDFVFFNQMGIAHILDSILKQSIHNNVNVELINYTELNKLYKAKVFEKESIDIKARASFNDVMNLLQYIDSLNALFRVNKIEIYLDENQVTNFNLNISHYGVEL